MKKKFWVAVMLMALVVGLSGCGSLSMLVFEESFGYGDRSAETFSDYLQGMEVLIPEGRLAQLEKEWMALPEWDADLHSKGDQKEWIAFEEQLRQNAIPMVYTDLETFLATERQGLEEAEYEEALRLIREWEEIPEGAEANIPVEAALDQCLVKLGLSFHELVEMVNDREAVMGVYGVADHGIVNEEPAWLQPMKKSSTQDQNILALWERIETIIPQSLLGRVREFAVVTDGEENMLAYVYPLEEAQTTWRLTVDYLDFVDASGNLDVDAGDETLIHEFGHILSLNETQMDPQAKATLALEEGNLAVLSYLNRFYQEFWRGMEKEWEAAVEAEDSETALFDFFIAHEDRFLNDYAATSPAEDFAEMFAQFVLRDRPQASLDYVDQKIQFFYQFPDLVEIREKMRQGIKIMEEAA